MRIGNNGVDQLGTSSTGAVNGASPDSRTSSAGSQKSDSVNLSNAQNLIALAKAGAVSRQVKVDQIGSQVRSGQYQTDSTEVSQAVVQGHIS
jgi:anti-sigma28 factor (negative regulator of flagellin synthesis)